MASREHILGDNWFSQVREISADEALVTASEQFGWRSMLWHLTGLTTVQAAPPVDCMLHGFANEWVQDEGDRAWVDVEGYWFSAKFDPDKNPGHRQAVGASGHYLFAIDAGCGITWHLGERPAGKYRISVLLPYATGNADEHATYTIHHAGRTDTTTIDQNKGSFLMEGDKPKTEWKELGVFELDGMGRETVTLTYNQRMVNADGLKLERAK
jgi:hypothetical protein